MFKLLEEIDWASMNHAYGTAEDVPELIRGLASEDDTTRDEAFYTAYGNIFHQGSRYEATAPAVPFLLEILEQPDYAATAELLYLLAHLVMGYSEAYVPYGFSYEIEGMRAELAVLQDRPAEERAEDETDDLGWGTDEDWLQWMVNITDEVRKGVPRFIRLLTFDDANVRTAAAFTLSWLPEDIELFGPALWEVASTDVSDEVRANALIALTLASDDDSFEEYAAEVEGMLSAGEPIVQFAAAIALGTRCPETAPDAVVQILLDAVARAGSADADDEEAGEDWGIAYCDGDYGSYASEVLTIVCADDPGRIVSAVSEALPGMQTLHASSATGTVLNLLFPEGFEGESAGELDKRQREFLELLAEVRGPWFMGDAAFGNFSLMMSDFNLPSSMEELRKFLA